MTKKEYDKKYHAIAVSNASVEVKEKAIEDLNNKFKNIIDKAMSVIEESEQDYSDIVRGD
ncbi:MAG: hypothetical protein WC179_05180 [Candidatus Cloacimonadaceae bacterium]|jgi:hypothetical protein